MFAVFLGQHRAHMVPQFFCVQLADAQRAQAQVHQPRDLVGFLGIQARVVKAAGQLRARKRPLAFLPPHLNILKKGSLSLHLLRQRAASLLARHLDQEGMQVLGADGAKVVIAQLLLVDGSYFSLAHPALDRLRDLIDEAAELAEWQTGPRIS